MESRYRKHNIYLLIYMLIFIMWLGSVFIKATRADGNQILVEKGDYFDCCEGWILLFIQLHQKTALITVLKN